MRIGNEYTVDITEHTQFILRTRISSVRNELYRATYAGTGREAHNNLCEKYLDAIVEYADYVISDQSSEVSVAEEILTFLDTVKVGLGDIRARNLVSSERCYDMFTQALFFLGYRWPPEEFRTE